MKLAASYRSLVAHDRVHMMEIAFVSAVRLVGEHLCARIITCCGKNERLAKRSRVIDMVESAGAHGTLLRVMLSLYFSLQRNYFYHKSSVCFLNSLDCLDLLKLKLKVTTSAIPCCTVSCLAVSFL
jgi:hypothetical protein